MAQALVAELARLRALVQELELALELQLERKPPLVRVQGRESARQQELAAALESPQSQEPAVEPEQVRELRVSRRAGAANNTVCKLLLKNCHPVGQRFQRKLRVRAR